MKFEDNLDLDEYNASYQCVAEFDTHTLPASELLYVGERLSFEPLDDVEPKWHPLRSSPWIAKK
jgi:hypothetical protein